MSADILDYLPDQALPNGSAELELARGVPPEMSNRQLNVHIQFGLWLDEARDPRTVDRHVLGQLFESFVEWLQIARPGGLMVPEDLDMLAFLTGIVIGEESERSLPSHPLIGWPFDENPS